MAVKKQKNQKKKAAAGKLTEKKVIRNTLYYYYLLTEHVPAGELAVLAGLPEEKTEVWTEMNLCELILEHDSLVLEEAIEDFSSPDDQKMLEEMGILLVYSVSFDEQDEDTAKVLLQKMIEAKGGFIGSDTEDFQPLYLGNLNGRESL